MLLVLPSSLQHSTVWWRTDLADCWPEASWMRFCILQLSSPRFLTMSKHQSELHSEKVTTFKWQSLAGWLLAKYQLHFWCGRRNKLQYEVQQGVRTNYWLANAAMIYFLLLPRVVYLLVKTLSNRLEVLLVIPTSCTITYLFELRWMSILDSSTSWLNTFMSVLLRRCRWLSPATVSVTITEWL